jgi:hypothetical protein
LALSFALQWKGGQSEFLHLHHSRRLFRRNGRNLRLAQSTGDIPWNTRRLCRDLRNRRNRSRLKTIRILFLIAGI